MSDSFEAFSLFFSPSLSFFLAHSRSRPTFFTHTIYISNGFGCCKESQTQSCVANLNISSLCLFEFNGKIRCRRKIPQMDYNSKQIIHWQCEWKEKKLDHLCLEFRSKVLSLFGFYSEHTWQLGNSKYSREIKSKPSEQWMCLLLAYYDKNRFQKIFFWLRME